jgi:hypothetical protein
VVSEFTLRAQVHTWPTLPPMGHALPHVRLWVQDELGQPLRLNQPGELYVGRGASINRSHCAAVALIGVKSKLRSPPTRWCKNLP